MPDQAVTRYWPTWGFGIQMGLFSYPFLKIFPALNDTFITLVGRILSLLYSLALIGLVFIAACYIFGDKKMAVLNSFLIAVFDLTTTYSHYATPDTAHTFWYYLSIFLLLIYYSPKPYNHHPTPEKIALILSFLKKHNVPLLSLVLAMTLAIRFDFVPLIIFLVFSTINLIKKRPVRIFVRELYQPVKILALTSFLFLMIHAGVYFPSDFIKAAQKLVKDNTVPYAAEQGFLYKPLLYPLIIIAGTSLPIFLVFVFGFFRTLLAKKATYEKHAYLFLTAPLFLSFLALYFGPPITVRRAAIFLPFMALVTAPELIKCYRKTFPKTGPMITWGVLLYTLSLTLISQYYFVKDTRFQAEEFLKSNYNDKIILYSEYAYSQGMPLGILLDSETTILAPRNYDPILVKDYTTRIAPPEREQVIVEPDVVVLHETYYGRYWKSISSPFKRPPQCCEEVSRCKEVEICLREQAALGNTTDFKIVKKFEVKHPFPERIIFKKLFGTYETFLGDTLVLEKN